MSAKPSVEFHPPQEPRQVILAPVYEVTVQEDRAQIQRRCTITLPQGVHKLRIEEVAASLQDVSLRASVAQGQGRISDVVVRRAIRIERQHQRQELRELEEHIEQLRAQIEDTAHEQRRAYDRQEKLYTMIAQGAVEIPQDTAWGLETLSQWADAMDALMSSADKLRDDILEAQFTQQDLGALLQRESLRRQQMNSPNERFSAWLEVDLIVEQPQAELELHIDYVCPNAIWRPLHRAKLTEGGQLELQTLAAVWQNTGEDWEQAKLVFSTTRASLGIEPPYLDDDLLTAKRKVEQRVEIQAREVEIQTTQVEGGSRGGGGQEPPSGVDLPGVDDGGDPQNLRPPKPVTVRSDGQPHFIALNTITSEANQELIAYPELSPYVFLRTTAKNTGKGPLLAGPVELIRRSGSVGWTTCLFVAPGEPFELSFGPQEELRVQRYLRVVSDKVDEVDKWRRKRTEARHFISNLGDEPKQLIIKERVPVSEIEHVRIKLIDNRVSPATKADDNGICEWKIELDPYAKTEVLLTWELALAPDVANMPI